MGYTVSISGYDMHGVKISLTLGHDILFCIVDTLMVSMTFVSISRLGMFLYFLLTYRMDHTWHRKSVAFLSCSVSAARDGTHTESLL